MRVVSRSRVQYVVVSGPVQQVYQRLRAFGEVVCYHLEHRHMLCADLGMPKGVGQCMCYFDIAVVITYHSGELHAHLPSLSDHHR